MSSRLKKLQYFLFGKTMNRRPSQRKTRSRWNHEVSLRAKVKEQRTRNVMKVVRAVSLLVLFGSAMGIFVNHCLKYLLNSKSFLVRNVHVLGHKTLTEQEVMEIASVDKGRNIFRIDTEALRKNFSSNYIVKNVKIKKVFPDTIRITVEEREGIGRVVKQGKPLLFDREGILFEEKETHPPLPAVYAEYSRPVLEKIAKFLDALKSMDPSLYSQLKSVDARSLKNLKLYVADMEIDWGMLPSVEEEIVDRIEKNLVYLHLVLDDLKRKSIRQGWLDLRLLDGEKEKIIFKGRTIGE